MFTIELVAHILVITKESGTIARKTGSLFVQFISREINQATSSLTFSTRNSILETRYSKLSRIEYRVSRLEDRGSRDCQLTFERYCNYLGVTAHSEPILWPISPAFLHAPPPNSRSFPMLHKKTGQCLRIRKVEWNVVRLLWYCHIDINN